MSIDKALKHLDSYEEIALEESMAELNKVFNTKGVLPMEQDIIDSAMKVVSQKSFRRGLKDGLALLQLSRSGDPEAQELLDQLLRTDF